MRSSARGWCSKQQGQCSREWGSYTERRHLSARALDWKGLNYPCAPWVFQKMPHRRACPLVHARCSALRACNRCSAPLVMTPLPVPNRFFTPLWLHLLNMYHESHEHPAHKCLNTSICMWREHIWGRWARWVETWAAQPAVLCLFGRFKFVRPRRTRHREILVAGPDHGTRLFLHLTDHPSTLLVSLSIP